MSGFYVKRGYRNHPLFSGEKYTRAEAWLWLIENAAWKDQKVNIGGKTIIINRGQLSYSFRFMAEAWEWSIAKVQRFTTRLKTDTMIDTHTDTGQIIITICNYNKYQTRKSKSDTPSDTPSDTGPIRDRYGTDTNKIKDDKGDKGYGRSHNAISGKPESAPTLKIKSERGKKIDDVLVEDFISEKWGVWAMTEMGWSEETVCDLAEEFISYWRGTGKTMRNWFATWQNNCRKEQRKFKEKADRDIRYQAARIGAKT